MTTADISTRNEMEKFIDRCRQEGLKVTPQRIAIYEVLMGSKEHPSADTVFRKIASTHPTISFDTVNRTLLTFAGIGVIDMVESFSVSRRFDTDTSPHHHLHCTRCGHIVDFNDPELDEVKIPAQIAHECKVTGVRMVVSCICPECGRKVVTGDESEAVRRQSRR
ncbi:MAG: transcriptional repressor [Chlorobiaceae bacterium]|nr:transcriptional repressor [Chlorobiaceae bacterium]